ncbi:MAG TPA: glycosyltransferase [Thermodesulfobacteriota bacterium]|nr:glycosyltransferase [Thermodesulfobacteriota bacterium]
MIEPICDIIIPIWNQLSLTQRCLEAVRKKTRTPHRLILIDNGSEEGTRKYLEGLAESPSWTGVLVRNEKNRGYIQAVNQGLKISTAPYVCLLNNDIVVTAGWLERMIEFAGSHPEVGLVNPQQNHDPGKPMPDDLEGFAASQVDTRWGWMELDHCTGGCLLIKREVIEKIGFLDETYGQGYYEDNDYSRRAQRAGYRCLRLLDTFVWHDIEGSFKEDPDRGEKRRKNEALYQSRWGNPLRIIYPIHEGVDFRRARFHQVFQTVHALARQNCEIDLILGRNRVNVPSEGLAHYGLWPHENLRIHLLPTLRREAGRFLRVSWDGVFLWGCLLKVRELLRQRGYNAIYTRHLNTASFFLRFKKYLRLPIVFEAHEIFFLTTDRHDKREKIKREEFRTYPRLDGIVFITQGLEQRMKEVFSLQAPMAVVPDGVNLDFFGGVARQPRSQKIIYVGQLYPWKGAGTLVEAMQYLATGELHLVGGSEERVQELKEKAEQLGVGKRVWFHGQVSPQEVKNHLAEAAVAVLPLPKDLISASFTSPLKLFEYMAARLPIVASDLPSTREVLSPGVNALLVPPNDPQALGEGIQRLLEDRSRAEGLGQKAYEGVMEFTWEKRAQKISHFIRSLSREGS